MKTHEAMAISNFLQDIANSIISKQQEVDGKHSFEYVIRNDDEFFIEHLKEAQRTIANEHIGKCINDAPDYKREVFDLLLDVQLPGVESIEVNESKKKFAVHYNLDDPSKSVGKLGFKNHAVASTKFVEKLYTFEDIKEAWYKFKEHEDGPWEGNFPDFLYGYAFPEYKNIKEVKPVFHDRLIAEPKLTKE